MAAAHAFLAFSRVSCGVCGSDAAAPCGGSGLSRASGRARGKGRLTATFLVAHGAKRSELKGDCVK